jgi:single-strand DNA-binding protein
LAWGVNHCLLEAEVLEVPQLRYTQDNQTPVAELTVRIDGLRPDDPSGQLKVVGWGSLAQDIQNRLQVGQRLVLEGRMRMNTVPRPDGVKEKRAELILSRLHPLGASSASAPAPAQSPPAPARSAPPQAQARAAAAPTAPSPSAAVAAPAPIWDPSPLVPREGPDDDDIPF